MTRTYNLPYSEHHQPRRRMDVFRPDQPNGAGLFFVHGGGWKAGAKEAWHPVLAHFCGQGYVCATAEYRLCPETGLLGILEDLRLVLAFMKEQATRWGFDPQRVVAYGSSAGGHLVGMLATIRPEDDLGVTAEMTRRDTVPQAVVAINPALSLSPLRPDLVPERLLADWPPTAGSPEPQERLGGGEPPCLIVVGDQDETTPLPMQEAAAVKLQGAGVPVELIVVPGAVHGAFYGVSSDHQRTALPAIEAFITRWLKT